MYYPAAKLGDDKSSGFCVIMLTYTQSHSHRAANRTTHAGDYVSVSKN